MRNATANLFTRSNLTDRQIATDWPRRGSAVVARSHIVPPVGSRDLSISVASIADSVPLMTRLTIPDSDGLSIWAASFYYLSDGPWSLVGIQYPAAGAGQVVFNKTFPANTVAGVWQTVQVFTVAYGPIFEWAVAGSSSVATVDLGLISTYQVLPGARISPVITTITPSSSYAWTNLDRAQPYLLVALLRSGWASGITLYGLQVLIYGDQVNIYNSGGGIGGEGTVEALDDATAPTYPGSLSHVVIPSALGSVCHIQPSGNTLRLQIPTTLSPVAVYALSFDGPTLGNSI